jgi:hypothetical protein
MSRTLNHVPAWVKERSPLWRDAFYEEHDHSTGPCDIGNHDPGNWRASRCHINYRNIGRNHFCGCHMCTGHDGRKTARRQERAAWRGIRQAVLSGELDGIDVPAIRGSAW